MVELIRRNAVVAVIGGLLLWIFWLSRSQWVAEMRLWRAIGDVSLIFLYLTLALGPATRFLPALGRALPFRRELGIWFGIFAIIHTILILDGWAQWSFFRFMGYEVVPGLGDNVRIESGFGMANLLGLLAVLIALPLLATSTDWATRMLGGSAWKFLHYSAYTIFFLVAIHTVYFLYIHFTASFHRTPPPDANWLQIPFAVLTAVVLALQAGAFFKTVRRRRLRSGSDGING